MNNKKAKQMIEETQGVLFLYEQRVKGGVKRRPVLIVKNNNRAFGMLLHYGYRF